MENSFIKEWGVWIFDWWWMWMHATLMHGWNQPVKCLKGLQQH